MTKKDRVANVSCRVLRALPLVAIVAGGLLTPRFQPWLVVATIFWFQVYFLFEVYGK